MKRTTGIITGVIVFLALILLSGSFYIVEEDEVAIVSRLGRIDRVVVSATDEDEVQSNLDATGDTHISVITSKGLQFKAPFIETVETYTAKYLTYLSNEETVNTNDGRRIDIQMYAQYRIIDPIVYKKVVGNESNANRKMDDNVYKEVINSANKLDFNEFFYETTLEELIQTRQDTLNERLVTEFGLYVSDIGINQKSFPESNITTIEEKMAKEIEKDSEKLIAEGDSEYIKAQAATDRQRAEIVSAAVEEAAIIKAEADAEAIRVYQESLGGEAELEFYQFIKRMEIYDEVEGSTVFLDSDSEIFNLLEGYESILENAPEPMPVTEVEETLEAEETTETVEETSETEDTTNN